MNPLYVKCGERNKKVLQDLGFSLSAKTEAMDKGFIEIWIKEKNCFWEYKHIHVNYYTMKEFLKKYKGMIVINNLNLL